MERINRVTRAVVATAWVCCVLMATLVSAQDTPGLTGRVADSSGGVIVDARITVTGAGGITRRIRTDERGEFRVGGLPAGEYVVRVEQPQFRSVVVAVRLDDSAPTIDVPVVLQAAGMSEHVAVTGRQSPYADPETTTAGKVPGPRRRVPNSVSILTREQMNDQNMVNTWDALSQVTGVTAISNNGSQSQFHARGAALEAQQDGTPSAMPLSGYQQYDLAIYDRVEVLRGPAGLLQGAGSFSGTVNFVRRRPTAARSVSVLASTGRWDNQHAEAAVSMPLASSLRSLVVLSATDRDFFYERGHDRKWVGYGALEWDAGKRTTVTVGAVHQEDRTPGFSGLPSYTDGRLLDVSRSFNPYPEWNHSAWDTSDLGVDVEHRFSDAWKLVGKVNRRTQTLLLHESYPVSGIDRVTGTAAYARRESSIRYSGASADFYMSGSFRRLAMRHQWLLGADGRRFDSRIRSVDPNSDPSLTARNVLLASPPAVAEPTFTYRTGRASLTEQAGIYTRLRSTLGRVTTVLGGRWTSYDAQSRDASPSLPTAWAAGAQATLRFTPTAGTVVDISRDASAYGSYSEIFVPQTQKRVDGSVLEPRVGHQWEVGVKGEHLNQRLLSALAVFDIRERNGSYPDPLNPNFSVPLGEVESKGWEAELTGRVTPRWDLSAGYTWLETRYLFDQSLTGQPISYWYPKHSLKVWSAWRVPNGRLAGLKAGLGAQAYSRSASGSDTVNAAGVVTVAARRQGAYAVIGANLSYPLRRDLQLGVQANNLFDRVYYTRLGGTNTYNTFGEPRNLNVFLRWQR